MFELHQIIDVCFQYNAVEQKPRFPQCGHTEITLMLKKRDDVVLAKKCLTNTVYNMLQPLQNNEQFLPFLTEYLWCTKMSLGFISWDTWLLNSSETLTVCSTGQQLARWLFEKNQISCLRSFLRAGFYSQFFPLLAWMRADKLYTFVRITCSEWCSFRIIRGTLKENT